MDIAFKCFATGWAIFVAWRMLSPGTQDHRKRMLQRYPQAKEIYCDDGTLRPFYRVLVYVGTVLFIATSWLLIPKTFPF